jgi:CHAP domain
MLAAVPAALALAASVQAAPPSPASATPPAVAQALQTAQAQWAQGAGDQFLASFRNGQCTDWASQKRPDFVESVWVQLTANDILVPGQSATPDFTAKNWGALAQAAGLTVKNTPVTGAIAVWQPSADGGIATGHVGYVESVSPAGSTFVTSEMNDLGVPYKMVYRTLSSAPRAGVTFIDPPAGFKPVLTALDKPAFDPATNGSRAFTAAAQPHSNRPAHSKSSPTTRRNGR